MDKVHSSHNTITSTTLPLPMICEAEYVSKPFHCQECRLPHSMLLSPKKRKVQHSPSPIIHKIGFLDDLPVYESLTGYLNLSALLNITTDLTYSKAFAWFMESRFIMHFQVKLWEYYELPKTILSGTARLKQYRYDSRQFSSITCRECLPDGRHIWWLHPYFVEMYASYMRSCCPDALDTKIMTRFIPREIVREYHHFCLDMGIPTHDMVTFMHLRGFFPDTPSPVRPEYIYLVQQGTSRLYKIGKSQEPEKRLQSMQTSSPIPLHLVHFWQVPDAGTVERVLHIMFASTRRKGEWFALSHTQEAELIVYMTQYGSNAH